MANTLAPFGLRYLGVMGASPNVEMREILIDKDDTTAIFRGDPVKFLTTGYGAQWTAGTAAAQLAGVFVGCRYLDTASGEYRDAPYWPGSGASEDVTAKIIPIIGGALPRFLIQANGATAFPFTQIGTNFDVSLGTGNTTTGQSAAVLDVSTGNSTATLPFRAIERWRGLGNGSDHTSANSYVVVVPNLTGPGTGLT